LDPLCRFLIFTPGGSKAGLIPVAAGARGGAVIQTDFFPRNIIFSS